MCGIVKNVSLSARRAWIEISRIIMLVLGLEKVALRKESVDRNDALPEIDALKLVALRKESVDRNSSTPITCSARHCRSPQGERG